jgi:hypothetical protein
MEIIELKFIYTLIIPSQEKMRKMQLGVTGRNQCQLSSSNYKLVVKARNMNLWLELDNCMASVAQLLRALRAL